MTVTPQLQEHPQSAPNDERGIRVLILSASIGEGHDLPARTLAEQLRVEDPSADVRIVDSLPLMGKLVQTIVDGGARVAFLHGLAYALWDLWFGALVQFSPTRSAAQRLLQRVGGTRLLRVVEEIDPDVVVSTYPIATEALAPWRRRGRLTVPLCSAITDVAALRYWAAPGVDVHLITHPESDAEVRAIAGRDAEVHCVHGLTRPDFLDPPTKADARAELGLPAGKVVLVSGGGWGVGDLEAAIDTALGLHDVELVGCLCGRNEELRHRLARTYGSQPRVRIEGFVERMAAWLSAGDALVHSTGGLTVLEALMCGCPAISFGWGRGHIRVHNDAYRRFGLADVATSTAELRDALAGALARPKPRDRRFAQLPSAASVVFAHNRSTDRFSTADRF